jgi:prepilin-type N-terminal cleavage/methylation domain-containing protein
MPGGFTLLELMAAMSIASAMLVVIATLFSKVMAANSAAAEHLRGVVALADLGRQFREDVHTSTSATITDADRQSKTLVLSLADGSRVEYAPTRGGLRRSRTAQDQPQRRDVFLMSGLNVVEFKAGATDKRTVSIVIARMARQPGIDDVQTGQFEIIAVAAGDLGEVSAP